MAFTEIEEARIANLEATVTKVLSALQNVASKRQLNQLLAVLQKENTDLRAEVATLKSEVALLKAGR